MDRYWKMAGNTAKLGDRSALNIEDLLVQGSRFDDAKRGGNEE
jgi:hypothetical protein